MICKAHSTVKATAQEKKKSMLIAVLTEMNGVSNRMAKYERKNISIFSS